MSQVTNKKYKKHDEKNTITEQKSYTQCVLRPVKLNKLSHLIFFISFLFVVSMKQSQNVCNVYISIRSFYLLRFYFILLYLCIAFIFFIELMLFFFSWSFSIYAFLVYVICIMVVVILFFFIMDHFECIFHFFSIVALRILTRIHRNSSKYFSAKKGRNKNNRFFVRKIIYR